MKSRSGWLLLPALLVPLAVAVLLLAAAGPRPKGGTASMSPGKAGTVGSISDKPLAAFQLELLDLAFKTASALPVKPFIKNRSRAQEAVVAACFELDQPRRALGYIEKIDNWRRGAGYADFALYCARHGDTAEVQHYLDLARQTAETAAKDEDSQDWQIDRIRVKMAQTHAWLGQTKQASKLEAGVVDSETAKVAAVQAMRIDAAAFDEQLEGLDAISATGNLDQVRNALQACARLFDRFYDDPIRRSRVEASIQASLNKLPAQARIELLSDMASIALDHEDKRKALDFIKDSSAILESPDWTPEYQIPLLARLAGLLYSAGEKETARSEVDSALALFDERRDEIASMFRAGAIRPLAETYHSMGDTAAALALYRRVVEEGVTNPNPRPRAEDLSATCCSLALHRIEPDADLLARMVQIHGELAQSW